MGRRLRRWKGGKCGARQDAVVAAAKHRGGNARHDGLSLHMQVPVHLIGFPPTDEADAIAIDPGAEESHGAPGARGASGDVRGSETKVRTEEDRGAHIMGEVGREEVGPRAVARPDGTEGCGGGCGLRAQVSDASNQTKDGTQRRVARARVANGLTTDAILLRSESESGKGGRQQIR